MHAVISGECPPKPDYAERIGVPGLVWDLLRECWREGRQSYQIFWMPRGGFATLPVRKTADSVIHPSTHLQIHHGVTVSPLG